jgi:glyoxylase-like metal-dependent hydrolase (beta-lactamase superfamily II)
LTSVVDLGGGAYLFRWPPGFYLSPFLVTSEGVVAVDPISPIAARAYREAIRSLTDAPVRAILYSHDHRDHIAGASELSAEAEVIAHARALERIQARGDGGVRPPARLVDDGDVLRFGSHEIQVHYFGPSHSRSNIALRLATGSGRLLVFVDVVEPGVVPYRELPDTDFAGLLRALEGADALEFDCVMGGHTGPGERRWVADYLAYLRALQQATEEAFFARGDKTPLPGEDGVAMTERVRGEVCQAAAARLRDRYGHWRGFDAWAPRNADRVLSYLITGN